MKPGRKPRLLSLRVGFFAILCGVGPAAFGGGDLNFRAAELAGSPPPWRIIIANDTCPDVTWGFTEAQVRQSFADLIRAHLDEMNRTDSASPENRDHYNLMAYIEAEAFFEIYPDRKDEFIRRAREGRLCVSPFLCNTLWGFQSVEGVLRALYPARRLERAYGVPIDIAGHTELPSLPWGIATLMAGCGVRWTSVPFLDYDSTFKGLRNSPLFRFEGPDGSEVRVVMDTWASLKANYMQGGYLLRDTKRVTAEWVPHYERLGTTYPLRTIFASGTHSDINPNSWRQARGFADAITQYNVAGTNNVRLVNGTLAQFCREVDTAEQERPFLPKLRGCFGHSWELWPVSLAQTVAAARANERAFLAAESLVALAGLAKPQLLSTTRVERERAEWCWAMLGDHAWNGTDLKNKQLNAELRRTWAESLRRASEDLLRQAWNALGLRPAPDYVTVYNPLSFSNDVLVTWDVPAGVAGVRGLKSTLQLDGETRRLTFVAPWVPPFGFREFRLEKRSGRTNSTQVFSWGNGALEGPFYRLNVDPRNGGLASVVYIPTGQELVAGGSGRSLCQTVFDNGREHSLAGVETRAQLNGCTAELRTTGEIGDLRITNSVTLYATLDRMDFEVLVAKPPTTNDQRLLQFFPVGKGTKDLHIETTAAVLRPCPQPEGDLLPGADTRRFAVQGFVDSSPPGRAGVTIAPLDAYMLRLDRDALAFEALGNDQNWKEVTQDQDGVRLFRFRYSLRAHAPGYDNASAVAWSRSVAAPPIVAAGRLPKRWLDCPQLDVDPARAVVFCFKPADDGTPGLAMIRLWETAGRNSPIMLRMTGFTSARAMDLLERERGPLSAANGNIAVPIRGFGFAGVAVEK